MNQQSLCSQSRLVKHHPLYTTFDLNVRNTHIQVKECFSAICGLSLLIEKLSLWIAKKLQILFNSLADLRSHCILRDVHYSGLGYNRDITLLSSLCSKCIKSAAMPNELNTCEIVIHLASNPTLIIYNKSQI